jgi:hypothetical protein
MLAADDLAGWLPAATERHLHLELMHACRGRVRKGQLVCMGHLAQVQTLEVSVHTEVQATCSAYTAPQRVAFAAYKLVNSTTIIIVPARGSVNVRAPCT